MNIEYDKKVEVMATKSKTSKKTDRRRKQPPRKSAPAKTRSGTGKSSGDKRKSSKSLRRKRKMRIRLLLAAVLAAAAVFLFLFITDRRTYHEYKVLKVSEQEDIVSTKYVEMGGRILRYSPGTVSLVNKNMETIWSTSCDMQNPVADVKNNRAVIADVDGTTLEIYNRDGRTGTVTTSYSIVKARISSGGLVAAILDGGDDTWINFYASDGSLIAENQTKVDDPGYPMDVAVSDDGMIMMVTYQFVDGGETTSYVAFYNFGDVGQNEDDRIVSGYTYEGVVIPQIQYLDGSRSVALRDNGFSVFQGSQIPKETAKIEVEQEIVSTFFDSDTIGLVYRNSEGDKQYTMEVYSKKGDLKYRKDFNIAYTSIRMSDGSIIMRNSSQICVINGRGVEKFNGTVDGTVKDFFKIGWNRYLMVLDTGVYVVKLT